MTNWIQRPISILCARSTSIGKMTAVTLLVATACSAYATDSKTSGFFAAGVAAVPDFEGSSDYQAVPFITSHLHRGSINFEFEGLTARLHLKRPSWFEAGLSLRYRFGRDDDIENNVVGRLTEIDDTLEAGAFFRIELDDQWQQRDSVELQVEAFADTGSAHNGNIAILSASYTFFSGNRWRFELGTETTYADTNYMNTYFSVDAINAGLSGLPRFNSNSGFKDFDVNLNATYFLSERFGILGRVAYTRLIGDAADSPIIRQEGDADQLFGGLSFSYQF